jgi:hypothetical protein
LDEGHPNLALLNQMITAQPPTAHDDFSKEKEEKGSQ